MRRVAIAVLALVGLMVGAGALLLLTNPPPAVPAAGGASGPTAPHVIKLHARWCPICMVTRDAWASIQEAYAGRVRFVVFDFTSDETTEASRLRAGALGLETVFDEYVGETGTVLVLDGSTREVRHAMHGHHDAAEYRAAIDEALENTDPP